MDNRMEDKMEGRIMIRPYEDVKMLSSCEQCGCCSSACPVTGLRDFNVRRIVRHVELDLIDEIANTPFPWYCTTCGRCESVCPNGIGILDIIRPLRAMTPSDYGPPPDAPPPCVGACPAEVNIPGYLRLIAEEKPEEACAMVLEKVPFPGILGRVCMHPCEEKCRRGEVNQAVSICALKRYAADKSPNVFERAVKVGPETGRRVAVVGGGPAGLTAAFYLRKKGHAVTIFEGKAKAGGMMRYGIPFYRLPEDVLEKEIEQVLSIGIELKTGQMLGRDFTLESLKADGFDSVFLALGLQRSRKIELEGSDLENVQWGVDFLSDISEEKDINIKDRVLVVGGGNVAVDVALSALRLGAATVTMACLESREEMPANEWEIEMAREEGVKLMPSWGPSRILGKNGSVSGMELVRCASVFDSEGNFCPAFDDEKELVEVGQVILAIGQSADLSFLGDEDSPKIERGLIAADEETLETSIPGVYAGGEVGNGPGALIHAVVSGRNAAMAIDKALGGDGVIDEVLAERPETQGYTGEREKGFADRARTGIPSLSISERHEGFSEVDLCLSDEQAVYEAGRCLQCDLECGLVLDIRNRN